ncbi:dehypoxanthine futalosine cyclase [Halosquirtibacter xylanolyticus]|uniref:cyclic dehypoxanthinyl futalosine synthase n=1 Tax=Halosquirtibacter xylanolyticus TaxID=3374599 RepID=UPI0037496222|nr:dehypoxanthine futalosine cyclase [Prolixibacteraceae bacterium]
MDRIAIYNKAIALQPLTVEEGLFLYEESPLSELSYVANEIRKRYRDDNKVTWIIDRNVNITNVCVSNCSFCNFHRKLKDEDTFTTTIDEYVEKIEEMLKRGGNQLLLQGGMHPKYGIEFYEELYSSLKSRYPEVKLHSLGPPEIHHIARKSRLSYRDTLVRLMKAGLDSLPGAGAEILSDRVRKKLSPGKATTDQWLDVMREAHKLNMVTSATMMFGHIETLQERVEHLLKLREVQASRPEGSDGFTAFIPWTVYTEGTKLAEEFDCKPITPASYVRLIAMSRILLNNVPNIQASWLTVGKATAQATLYAGANDMGSIMIEENVVSSAGANYQMDAEGIQKAIVEAGFMPQLRNQAYEYQDMPEGVVNLS